MRNTTFGFRVKESLLVAAYAAGAFADGAIARDGVMRIHSLFVMHETLLSIVPEIFVFSIVFGLLTLVLVLLKTLWWLGVVAVAFLFSSLPALQHRPHILRWAAFAVVTASAIAGFFAEFNWGGPGGAFIG